MGRPLRNPAGLLTAVAFLITSAPSGAFADDLSPAVAHISVATSAPINTPIFSGDEVTTNDADGELQLDETTAVRLAANTRITVESLQPSSRAIRLERGTIEVRIADASPNLRIDSSAGTVVPQTPGLYRMSSVTTTARAPDDFDAWNDARDRVFLDSITAEMLDPRFGANGLYGYGTWLYVEPYGTVWKPNEPPDWAPYTQGSWVATRYGESWVANEPWGWAPYHYGRWVDDPNYEWLWIPGDADVAWQAALVRLIPLTAPLATIPPWGRNVGWEPLPWYDTTSSANELPSTTPVITSPIIRRLVPNRPAINPGMPGVRFPERTTTGSARVSAPGSSGSSSVSHASGGGSIGSSSSSHEAASSSGRR